MDVVHEDRVAVLLRPVVPEIDHRAAVSMPAAGFVFFVTADPVAHIADPDEMQMVGDGRDALVRVSAGLSISPGFVVSSLDGVEQMRVHAIADERLPIVVPVDAPGIGGPIGKRLPLMPDRMVPVDAAVIPDALLIRRARLADHRPVRSSVGPVQPTVRSPGKAIGQIVCVRMRAKPVQQDLRLAVGNVVAVSVRDEVEVRRRHDPRAAEPDLDAGDVVELVIEDRSLVEPPVAVGVLENQNPVTRLGGVVRVVVRFGDPESASVVDAEPDWLPDVRFAGKQRHFKPLRDDHRLGGLLRRQRFVNRGDVVCPDPAGTTRPSAYKLHSKLAKNRRVQGGMVRLSLLVPTSMNSPIRSLNAASSC